MKLVMFTLTSARSGTLYLRDLFRMNISNCACRHEPFFDRGNPTMLGPAIYDAQAGHIDRIRTMLEQKRAYIERLDSDAYLESSHAFLKSAYVAAPEFFPEMRLIHLIRDPLKVAKSEARREMWRRRVHAPFHYYRGDDGGRYFFWSLTMKEDIFRAFDLTRLSLFQKYLVEWIEIENRAMQFLESHNAHHRCFTLHSPHDLNDPASIRAMFEFLGLVTAGWDIVLPRRRNKGLARPTVVTPADELECKEVIRKMPGRYLELFTREPYAAQPWAGRLRDESAEFAAGQGTSGLAIDRDNQLKLSDVGASMEHHHD